MSLEHSELILNADGSIYHLNLLPEDIAETIIFVGDPDRVSIVSEHLDTIELKKGKREFITHTGTLNGIRISVISTGIGTDNIDIVLNELDALVNIDFENRKLKKKLTSLSIVRIGTSGAIQENIPVNSFVLSNYAIGFDGLLHYYQNKDIQDVSISKSFVSQTNWSTDKPTPYVIKCNKELKELLVSSSIILGFTGTNTGFYGPQGRVLRLDIQDDTLNTKLTKFNHENLHITNLEMETSGIYALAKLLGHKAVSLNCIMANRCTGEFSKEPEKAMQELIKYTLKQLTAN